MRFIRYYFLIIFISFLPFVGIFLNADLPHTHDGLVHLPRIGAYFKALGDLQIPVRWAGDLNYGYGMPIFNFMYHVPYLISSFLVFIGFGLVSAFKITLVFSFLLSGIFMFGFSLSFFKDLKKAFLATLFYQFFPFRLVEILVRGSFGEVYAYAFFPLVLWGLTLTFKKPSYINILITSLGTAFLIISHNALSLVFFMISMLFVLFFAGKLKNCVFGFVSLFIGLLLASFYWMPAIFEHKYTYGDLFMKNLYLLYFPPIQNFFIPNLFYDTKLQNQGIPVQFGLFHTLILIGAIFVFFKKNISKIDKKIISFSIFIFVVSFFIMLPISKFVWERLSLLRQFQFPWRLLAVSGFVMSFISVSIFYFSFFKKNIVYFLLLFLTIISTAYYWHPVLGWDKIDESYYWSYPLTSTGFGETDLIWSKGAADEYPAHRVDLIDGKGEIGKISKKSNLLTFPVSAKTPIKVVAHIQYFPGWRAYVDGRSVPIQFQYAIYRGEIVFQIPKGQHDIRLSFGESKLRFIADSLTIMTVISLIIIGIFRRSLRLK